MTFGGARRLTQVSANNGVLSGACECGAVGYEVADGFRYAANCHCSRCRAGTGSALKPFAGIERAKLRLAQGPFACLRRPPVRRASLA